MKDPRALSDKGVQTQMIRKLQKFLKDSGYSVALSRSDLQTPSIKVFSSLFQYVYGFIDPTCRLTGKIDDEVPALMKQIGYPFMISKKALSSVGSVHTWPQLLGCFSFLIDMIQMSFSLGDDLFCGDDFGCLDEKRPADLEVIYVLHHN
jgi:kinetochore protein NDC80